MKKAVVDTNILIDYLLGHDAARKELSRYRERVIRIITHMEILVGAHDASEEEALRDFLAGFTLRPFTREIAETAVRLRKRHGLKLPDAIVYATAREEETLIVSRNTRGLDPEWPDVRLPYSL